MISLSILPHELPEVAPVCRHKVIRVVEEVEPAALKFKDVPAYLGISTWQFWRLRNLPDKDPRKIRTTGYETVAISELHRAVNAATAMGKPLPRWKGAK